MRSAGAIDEFSRLSKGATFKEITLETLRKFYVLQPPLAEQIAIAKYVSAHTRHLAAVRKATQQSIELLLEHRSSLITNAVTGKIDVREAKEREAAA